MCVGRVQSSGAAEGPPCNWFEAGPRQSRQSGGASRTRLAEPGDRGKSKLGSLALIALVAAAAQLLSLRFVYRTR